MTSHQEAVDNAWKIHAAIVDWTGKVDSKASFVSAIESALLAGIISMAGGNRRLAHMEDSWTKVLFWFGVGVLILSLLAVLYAVRPRLRTRRVQHEAPDDYIFFGHLRDWTPQELTIALKERDILPVLARQIVRISKVAWLKHRLVQVSVSGAVAGSSLIGAAALLNG